MSVNANQAQAVTRLIEGISSKMDDKIINFDQYEIELIQ